MLGGPGGNGCDELRFPVHGCWDSRDVSVAAVFEYVKECMSFNSSDLGPTVSDGEARGDGLVLSTDVFIFLGLYVQLENIGNPANLGSFNSQQMTVSFADILLFSQLHMELQFFLDSCVFLMI